MWWGEGTMSDLRGDVAGQAVSGESSPVAAAIVTLPVGISLVEVERRMIEATLQQVGGNLGMCSQLLGISSRTLYRRLRMYKEVTS